MQFKLFKKFLLLKDFFFLKFKLFARIYLIALQHFTILIIWHFRLLKIFYIESFFNLLLVDFSLYFLFLQFYIFCCFVNLLLKCMVVFIEINMQFCYCVDFGFYSICYCVDFGFYSICIWIFY